MDTAMTTIPGLEKALFDLSPAGVMVTSLSGEIVAVNPAFTAMTGFAAQECLGKTPKLWHSGKQDDTFYDQMWNKLNYDRQWEGRVWNKRKNGELYEEELKVRLLPEEGIIAPRFVGIMREIVEPALSKDPLTGLFMRDVFMGALSSALDNARNRSHKTAVMFIDLDGFKEINDTFGHMAGDVVLTAIAQRMSDCVRPGDIVARMGGDEFAILVSLLDPIDAASKLAQRLLQEISKPIAIKPMGLGRTIEVSPMASVGIRTGPWANETPEELIAAADQAMYSVKRSRSHHVRVRDSSKYR
jgi:diguanylate cyclase (GGDEF)-like protein/PAS domain S-box-containing protein